MALSATAKLAYPGLRRDDVRGWSGTRNLLAGTVIGQLRAPLSHTVTPAKAGACASLRPGAPKRHARIPACAGMTEHGSDAEACIERALASAPLFELPATLFHTVTPAEAGACASIGWSASEVARADPGLRRDDGGGWLATVVSRLCYSRPAHFRHPRDGGHTEPRVVPETV